MTALDFLQSLRARGVVLSPRGRNLIIDAPAGALTVEDRVKLARHKAELLGLLASVTTPDDLPPEWHLLWDERAAIMEYDGGMPRERAEALALLDTFGRCKTPVSCSGRRRSAKARLDLPARC